MWKRYLFEIIGIISVLMLFFGVPLAIRESSRDWKLAIIWLIVAIVGFIGLSILAVRIMIIKKRLNTPRQKEEKK